MLSTSSSLSISIPSTKTRSITRLTCQTSLTRPQKSTFLSTQWRHYADEAATQSEPEADGATEAQHGDNSIASSADPDADANTTTAEKAEENEAASKVESATEQATEQASSAADSIKSAAQSAGATITGAAQSLGQAAGLGSTTSGSGEAAPAETTSRSVYVGNLFFDVKAEDLRKEFEKVGEIENAKIIMDPRGLSKGFVNSPILHTTHTCSFLPSLMLYLT